MNKIKQLAVKISENRGTILKRTLVIGVSVVTVTLVAGLFVKPEIVEIVETVTE